MFTKTKTWIVLFAALFALCAGAFLLLRRSGAGAVAKIWLDGQVVDVIDLSAVTAPYDFDVESSRGVNTVHVERGAISVIYADCPDQICVEQGDITDSAVPIVCVPHRLVIEIEGEP